jgi:hypothetical protein
MRVLPGRGVDVQMVADIEDFATGMQLALDKAEQLPQSVAVEKFPHSPALARQAEEQEPQPEEWEDEPEPESEPEPAAVPALVARSPFRCDYKMSGCGFHGSYEAVAEHELTCECRPW